MLLTAGPEVAATANIFGAGKAVPPGAYPGDLPPSISIPAGTASIEFSSITGTATLDNWQPWVRPYNGPDGGNYAPAGALPLTDIFSSGGISGLRFGKNTFLAGVFLTDAAPSPTPPPTLDFTDAANFDSLSPLIQQTFFIGDGLTGNGYGVPQVFYVPEGATRLFLGLVDGYDDKTATISGEPKYYDDNDGSFPTEHSLHAEILGTDGNDLFSVSDAGVSLNGTPYDISDAVTVSLIGGAGNDIYRFDPDSFLGTFHLDESGGGVDTISFASASTTAVSANLSLETTQTINANLSLWLNSATDFENLVGGSRNDKLTGNALRNTLTGGAGDDTLVGGSGNDNLNGGSDNDRIDGGAGNDELAGGTENDTYVFDVASAQEADVLTEESSAGTDTLTFSSLTTSVTVNLSSTAVQTVQTKRTLKLSSGGVVENVTGGSGNDVIIGNSRPNKLLGNAGNDVLTGLDGSDRLEGGAGRDLLFGGRGLDTVIGGTDDDILVAGRTASDASLADLKSLRTAWVSTAVYNTRIANLRAGVGTSGVSLKAKVSVLNDAGEDDVLTAGTGNDWYLKAVDDAITDFLGGEITDVL